MLFREEFLEKVIRPKVEEAAKENPETLYDLCALLDLPPSSIHTVAAWLRDLGIPVEDVCDLPLRARKTRISKGLGFDRYRKDSFIDSRKSVADAEHLALVAEKEAAEEEVTVDAAHQAPKKKKKKKSGVTISKSGKKKKRGNEPGSSHSGTQVVPGNAVTSTKVVKSRRHI